MTILATFCSFMALSSHETSRLPLARFRKQACNVRTASFAFSGRDLRSASSCTTVVKKRGSRKTWQMADSVALITARRILIPPNRTRAARRRRSKGSSQRVFPARVGADESKSFRGPRSWLRQPAHPFMHPCARREVARGASRGREDQRGGART